MKVYVNDRRVYVLPGMKVKHALMRAGLLKEMKGSKKVYDEWGNEVGLDGALSDQVKIYIRTMNNER